MAQQNDRSGLPSDAGMKQIIQYAEMLPADDPDRANLVKSALICNAPFIPKHIRGNPMGVMFLRMRAQELNIPFGMALQVLYPTPGGNIGMEAKAMRALLLDKGCTVEYPVNEPEKVTCQITRPAKDGKGKPQSYAATWTKARAEAYTVWMWEGQGQNAKKVKGSLAQKWHRGGQELQNMLRQRACSEAAREIAPDIIGGMYTIDEAIDIDYQPQPEPLTTEEKVEQVTKAQVVSEEIDSSLINHDDQEGIRDLAHQAGVPITNAINAMMDICLGAEEKPEEERKAYANQMLLMLRDTYAAKLNTRQGQRKLPAAKSAAQVAKESALKQKIDQEASDFVDGIGDPEPEEPAEEEDPAGPDPFTAEPGAGAEEAKEEAPAQAKTLKELEDVF